MTEKEEIKCNEHYLSWLLCRGHLWRWWGGKNKRSWLSRAVSSLEMRRQEKTTSSKSNPVKHRDIPLYRVSLTCVSPGEGEGFGTEVGPVIGCGGLFISRSFMGLH